VIGHEIPPIVRHDASRGAFDEYIAARRRKHKAKATVGPQPPPDVLVERVSARTRRDEIGQ
jgi:hypothetical protein